jgi:hypothetical protein
MEKFEGEREKQISKRVHSMNLSEIQEMDDDEAVSVSNRTES